jgi:hypothetical protein
MTEPDRPRDDLVHRAAAMLVSDANAASALWFGRAGAVMGVAILLAAGTATTTTKA